jgi:hypothetical protein
MFKKEKFEFLSLIILWNFIQLAFLTMTNIRHFWVASNSR